MTPINPRIGQRRDPLPEILAEREGFRDAYRRQRDPIAEGRLNWRAQSVRHLVHLTPGMSILDVGSGDGSFASALHRATRGENPICAASFQPQGSGPSADPPAIEHVRLDALPGALAGRQFDCVVGLDILDRPNSARLLGVIHDLLAPSGSLTLFETNPWNPVFRLRRVLFRQDSRSMMNRTQAYELLSDVGFVRVFAVYTDFVYAPLNRSLAWSLRNLSIIAENTPVVRVMAGNVLLHGQKPPRRQMHPSRQLCEHPELMRKVSVVIPCHNEEMNIGPLIERLLALYGDYILEIVPVDDNSTDATAEVLRSYAASDARVRPVFRSPPNGVGRALKDGLAAATGEWVLTMDSDFQHLLPELRDMFDRAAEGSQVVAGSRFSRLSVLLNYPLLKIISNRIFHLLAMAVMGRRILDATNNLKLMRREVVRRLDLLSPGFAANAETGLQPMLMGYKVEHSPISWINRSHDMGTSTFKLASVGRGYARVLWDVGRARWFGAGPYAGLVKGGTDARES